MCKIKKNGLLKKAFPDILTGAWYLYFGGNPDLEFSIKKELSQKSNVTFSFYPNIWKNTEVRDWLIDCLCFYAISAIFYPCYDSDY